jgi:putative ABC transport system permease protein
MAISLLIGNILLIGMIVGNIVYSNAVLNRLLVKDLNNSMKETGVYPLQTLVEIRMDNTRSNASVAKKVKQLEDLTSGLSGKMQLKNKELISSYFIRTNYLKTLEEKESSDYVLDLAFMTDLDKHSAMISGKMYSSKMVDGAIEVVVGRKVMMEKELMIGQELYLADVRDKDGNPYKIRIAGVFQNSSDNDAYWVSSPDTYARQFFMDEGLFRSMFIDYENPQYKFNSKWNVLVDYSDIKAVQVDNILSELEDFHLAIQKIDCYNYKEYFSTILTDFKVKQSKLENVLFLLEIPIFILLMIFIYMVNNQMMLLERGDIAVLKSRGASNLHVILIYLLQGVIILFIALLLGIPLGLFFCYTLGNANAFLEFVSRTALPLELTDKALMAAGLCALGSLMITLILAFFHTRENIVSYKRKMNKRNQKMTFISLIFGALFIGIAGYGLFSFRTHADTLAQTSQAGGRLDPLLFCSSIFFIIGAAFIVQAIFPYFIKLIFGAGKSVWNPSAYASFQKVIKGSDNQGFILLFIILTVSLGIFDATLARTINGNEEDRIRYSVGADLVVQEKWKSNKETIEAYIQSMKEMGQDVSSASMDIYYIEPDFNRYTELKGVKEATKVQINKNINISVDNGKVTATLMGINTNEFGEVAYFKNGLLDKHWFNYLNSMAGNVDSILVSANFKELGYKVGDRITYSDELGEARGTIAGFVEYWPTYQPVVKAADKDGIVKEIPQYLIVAHLSKLQTVWGMTPYQVWMKVNGSTSFIYDFAANNKVIFESFNDLSAMIINKNNDPFFQGTNGVLTLGFIIILLICAIGFLIFWILSIISRTLQFGVFRAMGMSIREIIGMLLREQFFLSVIPIVLGVLIGNYVSKLYVPLIQIAYSSSEQIIPLEIIRQQSDQLRILTIVTVMVILCMIIIGKLISNLKITQALKLGED